MRHPTLPWAEIDPLLKADVRSAEIRKRFSCSFGALSRRKTKLGLTLRWKKKKAAEDGIPFTAPFTPPAERLDLALRVKARRLGQPLEWMRSVWLNGEAGQGFLREYQVG